MMSSQSMDAICRPIERIISSFLVKKRAQVNDEYCGVIGNGAK